MAHCSMVGCSQSNTASHHSDTTQTPLRHHQRTCHSINHTDTMPLPAHSAVMGDRRHGVQTAVWRSSVLDSVVGTFLTQNVSDVLSSNAFMSIRSRWPARRHVPPRHTVLCDGRGERGTVVEPGVGGEAEYVEDDVDWHAVRVAPLEEVCVAGFVVWLVLLWLVLLWLVLLCGWCCCGWCCCGWCCGVFMWSMPSSSCYYYTLSLPLGSFPFLPFLSFLLAAHSTMLHACAVHAAP